MHACIHFPGPAIIKDGKSIIPALHACMHINFKINQTKLHTDRRAMHLLNWCMQASRLLSFRSVYTRINAEIYIHSVELYDGITRKNGFNSIKEDFFHETRFFASIKTRITHRFRFPSMQCMQHRLRACMRAWAYTYGTHTRHD